METLYEATKEDLQQQCQKCGKNYDETSAMMCCGKCKMWWHEHCTSLGKVPSKQYFCSGCRSSAHRRKEKLEVEEIYKFILPKENPDDSVVVLEAVEVIAKEEKHESLVHETSRNNEDVEKRSQNDECDDSDTASIARSRTAIAQSDSQVKHLRQTLYELPVFSGEPTK
ncbi:unnamed protein product [Diamesa tonsa]